MLTVDPEVAAIVRPAWFTAEPVVVMAEHEDLEKARRRTESERRSAPEPIEMIAAVRDMYKGFGIDPTKTRPSSEALWRRIRKGDHLPRINNLVDIINWCSLETMLPYGLYDLDRIHGAVTMRRGGMGEEYEGIRKAAVHLEGRLTLADDAGPFGNPTSDSARTMVTTETVRALVVIFAPTAVFEFVVARAVALTKSRIAEWASPASALG